jgi:oligopeptide/dipeptide ABC transporter ATP-binding protein
VRKILLEVNDLKVYYPVKTKGGGLFPKKQHVKAVDGISFAVSEGETFGIVGESGCGKSTAGKAIVKLLEPTEGCIRFEGWDIFKMPKKEERDYKKKIQMVFQDPYSSLDPRFTVERIIGEPLVVNGMTDRKERRNIILRLMEDVGIRPEFLNRYPHEFSGGQRQRIGVARALALHPRLLVCDEPVSALDVSIQAQILNLMKDLQQKYNLAYIFISHNLSVVKHLCDRVAVMYLGNIVELAGKGRLFGNPRHPYTNALLGAIPVPDPEIRSLKEPLEGDVPSPLNPPTGCCFHTRCKFAEKECLETKPLLREIEPGHVVACHRIK